MAEATEIKTNGETKDGIEERAEPGEAGNKFQQAVSAWRSLDLSTLVSSLDNTASELVSHQKEALVQRKELAQKTKDFKKLDDGVKLSEIKDLLRAYQNYIDVLTNHSKSVSTAFMNVYSPLSEAPDPYPLLEASIDSLVAEEEVIPRLEQENERLHKQVSKQNTQLEELEKQLEQERNKRQSFEGSQDSRIKEVEESWSGVLQEKEDNWAAKEKNLEEKVEGQERLLKELKANYEVSQRLEKSGNDGQDTMRNTAAAAELEIVNSELERANTRLADLESRNEHLRVELAQSASHANSSSRSTALEDDPAFLRLRSENSSLLRKLESARNDKDAEKSTLESKFKHFERELATLRSDREALQTKLQKWHDYEEIRRELEMLRAIEFATVDDDEPVQEEVTLQANGSAGPSKGESLEQLLLARNKKLSNELTELRVSHNDLVKKLEELQSKFESVQEDLNKSQKLNATLENDLQKTQQEATSAWDTASLAPTYTSKYPKSAFGSRRAGGGTSPTSSLVSGFDPSGHSSPRTGGGAFDTLRASEGSGQGILPMVTAQRDRFKKKISELEVELQKQYSTINALRSEVSSLQKDNLNLYEKTRYVSSYSRPTASSGAAYGANPNPSTISVSSPSDDRYRAAYESNISPFAAFRGRESARAFKRMTLPERAVFQVTRMVLQTRMSRNLFAAYCVGLHLLVLAMLYWMGSVDVEKHLGAGAAAAGDWHHEGFDSGTGT